MDKTHFPTVTHAHGSTLVICPQGSFWSTQDASGQWQATPVADEHREAVERGVAPHTWTAEAMTEAEVAQSRSRQRGVERAAGEPQR